MIITTMSIEKGMRDEIDKLCKGDDAIYPSRSEFIRNACLFFFRDFLIHEENKKEPIENKEEVSITDDDGNVVEIYKIIRGI